MYCRECGANIFDKAKFCPSCGCAVAVGSQQDPTMGVYVPGTDREQATQEQKRARSGKRTLILALLWMFVTVIFQVIGYVVGMLLHFEAETLATIGTAVGACVGIAVLGGARLMIPRRDTLMLALKKGWWVLATSVALAILEICLNLSEGNVVVESGWGVRFVKILVLCLAIGVSEEAMFRGLLLGGLLDICGKDRHGICKAAILCAVFFGLAHIDFFSMDYADPLSWLQAVLKVVQTGTYGFFLAALTICAKEFVGAALLHGLDDFLLMIPSMILLNGSLDVQYVTTGEDAWMTVVLYAVMIVLYIPLVVIGKRMINKIQPPYYGELHKG